MTRKVVASLLGIFSFWPLGSGVPARSQTQVDTRPSFAEPAISPDRSEIAFVSGGDIWTAPASGGDAHLLISHPANDSRPLYSPDGKKLAFVSTRTGRGDIYVRTFATGEVKRLTWDDASEQLDAWSRDGKWIYFFSNSRDISEMNDVFRVSVDGGTPMVVSGDRYANEYFSAPSPDGSLLAFTARGGPGPWSRKGHSHRGESEIWTLRPGPPPRYERVAGGDGVPGGEKAAWPMWTADGRGLYYVSDRGGAQNIWFRTVGANSKPRQVTQFKDGRVLWPNISYDGKAIVFERNFEVWKLDTSSGQAAVVSITRHGSSSGPTVEHMVLRSQFRDLSLSPDGQKVAFVAHGEVFTASARDGGEAARITRTPSPEYQVTWSPDSRHLVYVSERDGPAHVYAYDFGTGAETRLTNTAKSDRQPRFSPDGKRIAFERDSRELVVCNIDGKQERVVASGALDPYFGEFEQVRPFDSERPLGWSPDGRWIAYFSTGAKGFRNAWVVPSGGGEAKQVSFLGNTFGNTLSWSPDGRFLLIQSKMRTEDGRVAGIDLAPRAPRFREGLSAKPEDAKKDEAPNAAMPAKPVEIVFADIRRRLGFLPLGVDVNSQTISPDGKSALVIATLPVSVDGWGQQNLYLYTLDELAEEPRLTRQLTSTGGEKANAQFSPDGKEIFYLEQGSIRIVPVESRQPRPLAVTAELDVDFAVEKQEVFREAWTYLRDTFLDPNLNGVNWDAVRTEYQPYIAGARTPDELHRIISLMVGELNTSHIGISARPWGATPSSVGKIGLRFHRTEFESSGRLRVTEIIPRGPAALAGGIKTGDYLMAVDGVPVEARTNLDELLEHKVGKRVRLSIASAPEAGPRDVVVGPSSTAGEKNLLYVQWADQRRTYVERISNGRLGYLHMAGMGAGSLNQMYVDLDTENHAREGVVIDIRNNGGGFVNVYAIDVLARRHYMNVTPRGEPTMPFRTVLGQRALEAPTILLTNRHTVSDGENFAEGYRALGLGKVVGEPTAGEDIFAGDVELIDGSVLGLPVTRITTREGADMEMHPRPVDVPVTRPIGESYTDRDSQLEAAVRELRRQLRKSR